jgi:hypothetical protein
VVDMDVGALVQAESTRLVTVIPQEIQETRPIVFSRRRSQKPEHQKLD